MISRANGEIVLAGGVVFTPQCELVQEHLTDARAHQQLSVPGWTLHLLGEHESDHGRFEVQAVSDPECRIQTVLLSHAHPFYGEESEDDEERHAFHEGVLESDLGEQREFYWGEAFCRVDRKSNKDWLVVAYRPGPTVPLRPPIPPQFLHAHAPLPALNLEELLEERLKDRFSFSKPAKGS